MFVWLTLVLLLSPSPHLPTTHQQDADNKPQKSETTPHADNTDAVKPNNKDTTTTIPDNNKPSGSPQETKKPTKPTTGRNARTRSMRYRRYRPRGSFSSYNNHNSQRSLLAADSAAATTQWGGQTSESREGLRAGCGLVLSHFLTLSVTWIGAAPLPILNSQHCFDTFHPEPGLVDTS